MRHIPCDNMTLADARAWLESRISNGARCPCCGQTAKVYRRSISPSMAWGLCYLCRIADAREEYVHVPSHAALSRLGGDWAKLALWGLVEERETDGNSAKHSGLWRVTKLGLRFAFARCSLPKHVFVFNGQAISMSEAKTVTVHEALGNKFNWSELMRGSDAANW